MEARSHENLKALTSHSGGYFTVIHKSIQRKPIGKDLSASTLHPKAEILLIS